jgi:hypothetical protein
VTHSFPYLASLANDHLPEVTLGARSRLPGRRWHRFQALLPMDVWFICWELGFKQFSLHHGTQVSQRRLLYCAFEHPPLFPHAVFPGDLSVPGKWADLGMFL